MTIRIRILPAALLPGGALYSFTTRRTGVGARPLQYPEVPLPVTTPEGVTGAPSPGFIASASPLHYSTNINEDGTFPEPVGPTGEAGLEDQAQSLIVHVSPTSGSTIIRGNNWVKSNAELDPAYGLNITSDGLDLQDDVFETAVNEPVGAQFKANLQDLVARDVIEVMEGPTGLAMTPGEIAAYTAP